MGIPTLRMLLTAVLILAGNHPSVAIPVSPDIEGPPSIIEDAAATGQKPVVITTGNVTVPQTVIIDVPPTVDAGGATDTSREEVETTHKRVMKSLEMEGTEGNEVPVRQSSLEVAVAAKLRSECARRAASACLKLKLLTYMNRLLKKASISITDAVEISQTSEEDEEEDDEMRPEDLGEDALGEVVAEKVAAFVRTRSLRWKVLPEADVLLTPSGDGDGTVEVGVSMRGGRAAEKARAKLKSILPILAALKVKLGIIGALAIAALALLVGKAVLISKIALLLAAILGIAKLLSQQPNNKKITYEVVSHPHYTHSHGSSSTSLLDSGHHHDGYSGGAYGRTMHGSDLAYRAHVGDGEDALDGGDVSNFR